MFANTLCDMNFVLTVAYPNFFSRRARKTNGEDDYELLLVYVGNVLCYLHNTQLIMDELALIYDKKNGSVVPSTIYVGAEIN